jgi:hypothetical protein
MKELEPDVPENILKSKFDRREVRRVRIFKEIQEEYKKINIKSEFVEKASDPKKVFENNIRMVYYCKNIRHMLYRKKSVLWLYEKKKNEKLNYTF